MQKDIKDFKENKQKSTAECTLVKFHNIKNEEILKTIIGKRYSKLSMSNMNSTELIFLKSEANNKDTV